jgi:type VI secretion system protein VasD
MAMTLRTVLRETKSLLSPPLAFAAVTALLAVAPGCLWATRSDDAPATLDVGLTAATRVNPDEKGESLPTLVRVFQLTVPTKLEGATLESLYRDEKQTLGEQLLQVDELLLAPGESAHKTLARSKDARYVAVVGVFRRPAGLTWRKVVALPTGGGAADTKLMFVLEDYRVDQR